MSEDYNYEETDYTVIGVLLFLVGFALTSVVVYDYSVNVSSFWSFLGNLGFSITYQPYVKPEVVIVLCVITVILVMGILYAYRHRLFVKSIVVRA